MKLKSLIKNKLYNPVVEFIQQGLSPEKIAEAITLGFLFGIIPVMGATTMLCAISAFLRKLNMAAIQLVNWLVYPLQLLFYFPLLKLGANLFQAPIPFSIEQLKLMIKADLSAFLLRFLKANAGAVIIWLIISIPLGVLIFRLLAKSIKKISTKIEAKQ